MIALFDKPLCLKRRFPTKGHKRIQRQLEDERIDQVIQLKIQGLKGKDIADKLGITMRQVYRTLNTDVAKLKMMKTKQEIVAVASEVARRNCDDSRSWWISYRVTTNLFK